mmetsp:Transcript_26569/g.106390  ORF Transcript_26569/g.106390 Transcript_26569/m.106390 type:complete len:440 (-) Transcript_26569:2-1321(-)
MMTRRRRRRGRLRVLLLRGGVDGDAEGGGEDAGEARGGHGLAEVDRGDADDDDAAEDVEDCVGGRRDAREDHERGHVVRRVGEAVRDERGEEGVRPLERGDLARGRRRRRSRVARVVARVFRDDGAHERGDVASEDGRREEAREAVARDVVKQRDRGPRGRAAGVLRLERFGEDGAQREAEVGRDDRQRGEREERVSRAAAAGRGGDAEDDRHQRGVRRGALALAQQSDRQERRRHRLGRFDRLDERRRRHGEGDVRQREARRVADRDLEHGPLLGRPSQPRDVAAAEEPQVAPGREHGGQALRRAQHERHARGGHADLRRGNRDARRAIPHRDQKDELAEHGGCAAPRRAARRGIGRLVAGVVVGVVVHSARCSDHRRPLTGRGRRHPVRGETARRRSALFARRRRRVARRAGPRRGRRALARRAASSAVPCSRSLCP